METYLASEGFIAYQSRPNTDSMELVLDNGLFYEFVPFKESNFTDRGDLVENPEALTLKEVSENIDYALLISSCSGAWRYLIGDTIRFTSLARNEIQITGRTKHFLNLCGEHLSQENMNRAIEMMEHQLNIEVSEFTVAGIRHGSMFAHKWYIGTDSKLDPELVKEKIDENLKNLNDDYRVERIAAIKEIFVEILPQSVFYDYLKLKNKEGGQHKFPRVVKNEQYTAWESFVTNYKSMNK